MNSGLIFPLFHSLLYKPDAYKPKTTFQPFSDTNRRFQRPAVVERWTVFLILLQYEQMSTNIWISNIQII